MPKQYPTTVSRTLDPNKKSLVTVVGQHDHQITDADVNLIQDVQDLKRQRLLNDTTTSGGLTWQPFTYPGNLPNVFSIPSFDVLWNGEVVTIAGNNAPNIWKALTAYNVGDQITSGGFIQQVSTAGTSGATVPAFSGTLNNTTTDSGVVWTNVGTFDPTVNKVFLPQPQFYTNGSTNAPAHIYIVYIEMWYASLNPITGSGYFVDTNGLIGGVGLKYFYPYGCINASLATMLPDDSLDPFEGGLFTTERAQIQWVICVQPVALTYDFTIFRFGLDPGPRLGEVVYAQGNSASQTAFEFTNMGSINGDSGVWRAGDGNVNNSLVTMDGYSYAFPVAVCFQLNTGPFTVQFNPFGCSNPTSITPNSGLFASSDSGRFDARFADIVYQDQTVDTRQTVTLDGWDNALLCGQGFADLVFGATQVAIGRGLSPGNSPQALGSQLEYYVSVASGSVLNTNTVGAFDGFANGFSSDQRIFQTTKKVTIAQKNVGINNRAWIQNDALSISLPASSLATIQSAQVQILVAQVDGSNSPAFLLPGQISITGLGTKTVVITITANLTGTSFDPGVNPIYVTVGTQYPAGTGVDLVVVPTNVDGGQVVDGTTGRTLPVFGVSEFAVSAAQPVLTAESVIAYNNKFSNTIFGTRIVMAILGSVGVQTNVGGNTITTFTLNRLKLDAGIDGLYVISAVDSVSGNVYSISSRSILSGTGQTVVVLEGAVVPSSTVLFTFLANQTCQLLFNAPVKGVTRLEETVLVGNYTQDTSLPMDNRVAIVSNTFANNNNVLVLAASDCVLKGLSGDDVNKLIWVQNTITPTEFDAIQIASASFQNGLVIINVPGPANLTTQAFFFGAAVLPAFALNTQLIVVESYIPYQGEGVLNRPYEFLHTDDYGLVTTNGTGTAPIVGLQDIYPYNRQLPMSVSLPALITWPDSTLVNGPVESFFDSNFVAKKFQNVEHTFEVPLHTNDYIDPFNKDKRKSIEFTTQGGQRGFNRAIPHIGFAITPVVPKTVLGNNLLATQSPITLYVNNVNGLDTNDGLSISEAKLTIPAALAALPPVLRHPCNIQLINTGVPFLMTAIQNDLVTVALGDGTIVAAKYYAIGNIAFTIQESGRLVLTAQAGATTNVVIDATGYVGFGDGPTAAFFVDNSRVIFNQITFQNFVSPAIKGIASAIEFVACNFVDNIQAGSYEQACTVVITAGQLTLPDGGTGQVLSQSEMVVSGNNIAVEIGANPGVFYVADRGSNITLENHGTDTQSESNISATTVIATGSLNSSISTLGTYQSNGSASLTSNSVFQRTVSVNPFLGGVTLDASSSTTSNLS